MAKKPLKKISETRAHARLKSALREILKACGIAFDTEVSLNFSGGRDPKTNAFVDERSIDVLAWGGVPGNRFILIFECKSTEVKHVQSAASSWESDIGKLKAGHARVIASDLGKVKTKDITACEHAKVCYVVGENADQNKFEVIRTALQRRKYLAWNHQALVYYRRTVNSIGKAARYELLKEFNINLENSKICHEPAIRFYQRKHEMYLFAAKPADLLKIGYVSRRASGVPDAYQRIINKTRIGKIAEFVQLREALLPNTIIMAFDSDSEIQKHIRYEGNEIYFPNTYCSAWIIDGQHRVYGFLGTKFAKDSGSQAESFRLPVVAFKKLSPVLQNRTFVNINLYQKKIDPTLLCDLATAVPDLQNELTWPGQIAKRLNQIEPLKGKIKISELDKGKPTTIASVARYALLESLLGHNRKSQSWDGPLCAYAPFNAKATLDNATNKTALSRQVNLVQRFLAAVRENTKHASAKKDPWANVKEYSLLKPTGINALFLLLSRILEKYPRVEKDIGKDLQAYLKPLKGMRFTSKFVAEQGGGWKGFRSLANIMIRKINAANHDSLRLFGEKEKE